MGAATCVSGPTVVWPGPAAVEVLATGSSNGEGVGPDSG